MKVLFLGDVVAHPGRKAIRDLVPGIRKKEGITFVIANGENAAGGLGIEQKSAVEIFESGVDLITGGNHSWDKKEVVAYMGLEKKLLRPANYPDSDAFPCPGEGYAILEAGQSKLGVINLMGRVHMDPLDDPFAVGEQRVKWMIAQGIRSIFIDFHAEATSEKQAFAHFMAGRVSAVVGSHTHVQTADERILIGTNGRKTAYITDAGMTGPYDSVIGMKKEKSVQKFLTKIPQKYEPAEGQVGLHGVIVEINDVTGEAQSIIRVSKFLEER